MECLYRFCLYRTYLWSFCIEVHGQILFNLGTDDGLAWPNLLTFTQDLVLWDPCTNNKFLREFSLKIDPNNRKN